MVEQGRELQHNRSSNIQVIQRVDLLSEPLIENPQTIEEAGQIYFRDLAAIPNIIGIGFFVYPQGPLIGIYERKLIGGMTTEEASHLVEAEDRFTESVEKLTGAQIHYVFINAGEGSFEEIIAFQMSKRRLTDEEKNALFSGEIPEGIDQEESLGRYFEVLVGLSDAPIEEPVYIKFE